MAIDWEPQLSQPWECPSPMSNRLLPEIHRSDRLINPGFGVMLTRVSVGFWMLSLVSEVSPFVSIMPPVVLVVPASVAVPVVVAEQ